MVSTNHLQPIKLLRVYECQCRIKLLIVYVVLIHKRVIIIVPNALPVNLFELKRLSPLEV